MIRRLLVFTLFFVFQSLKGYSVGIEYSFPDGWQNQNMNVVSDNSVWECLNEEVIFIPPYYHAKRTGVSYWGASIITAIRGAYDASGGWMVKSPKYENGGPRRSTPTDYVTDIVGGWHGAFYKCTNTKKIVLPPTIDYIGKKAFDGCSLNELVCMAMTPPRLEEETFTNVTIAKIVVPKGTLANYKAADGWKSFTIVEGAEAYSEHQMVECNGAWYEVVNGEATLINSDDMTDSEMPLTLNCLTNGEWKTIPVKSIQPWSVGHDIVLNANITEIPENFRDGYTKRGTLSFSADNPVYLSIAPNVITNKSGSIAYYIFNRAILPHGITTIANNALTYCSVAYLPTTLSYIGMQNTTSAELYFTSEQPPTTSMTSYYGNRYVPKDYLNNYKGVFSSSRSSDIPAGYEYMESSSSSGYWNVKQGTCILRSYRASESDFDGNGVLNLPSRIYVTETMQGPIEEYNLNSLSNGTDRENFTDKINIPEGVKRLTIAGISMKELYLPSTLETCSSLSKIEGLKVIKVHPDNPKYDSRDNCNALIETATNTIVQGNYGTTFPQSVEHIGYRAFMGVKGMPNITIPENIQSIGKCAFQEISGEKVGYDVKPVEVSFAPSSKVTIIEDSTFYNSTISKVILSNSVTKIGDHAFLWCSKLKEITFGNSLKEIGYRSFYGTALTSLLLPDALVKIGNGAFSGIPTLETITFGNSLKEIGYSAFYSCGITTLSLPNSLEVIGDYAFENTSSLKSISFGTSLQSIGASAFSGCRGLQSLTLPNSIKTIGRNAFEECDNIQSLVFPMDSIVSIGDRALYTCPAPEELHLPYSLTSITAESFNLSNLKTLYTDSPTSIYMGYGSSNDYLVNLEKVVIGNRKKNTNVFGNRVGLSYCSKLKEVILGDSVETIGDYAFQSLPITSINIPKSLKQVGRKAFEGCSSLTTVNISDLSAWCGISFSGGDYSNPLSITHQVILNGEELKDLEIPDGVKKISSYAFKGCTNLQSLTVPLSVDTIRSGAFQDCEGLTRINISGLKNWCELVRWDNTFPFSGSYRLYLNGEEIENLSVPEGVDSINAYVFQNLKGLKSVKLPCSVKKIQYNSFYGCENIERIELGDSINYIGQLAFSKCSSLKEIICLSRTVPQCASDFMRDTPRENVTLYVPAGTKQLYTSSWNYFAQIVEMVDERSITITANDVTMKYGDAVPKLLYTNEGGILSGWPSISCEASSTSPVGEYEIVLDQGSVANPNVTYINGKCTVTKAPLLVKVKSYTIKQGDELPKFEIEYEGFKNDETADVLSKKPTLSITATSTEKPGTYDIVISGAEAENYEITYVKGVLTIEPVTVNPVTNFDVSFSDQINEGTDLTNAVIGNTYYNMNEENGDGFDVVNQAIVLNSTITPEQISDIENAPVGDVKIRENFKGIIFELAPGQGVVSIDAKTVGSHTLNVKIGNNEQTGVHQTERGNIIVEFDVSVPTYVYLYASTSDGNSAPIHRSPSAAANSVLIYGYKVIPASPVTITAKSYTIEYGDALPTFEYTSAGATLSGTPTVNCEATTTSPVGTYPIVVTKGTVTNYNDTYVNGTLTITKAPLTVTAKSYTIKQGEALPTFEAEYSGWKNSETSAVLTVLPTLATTATSASAPGTYDITVSGAEATNYDITYVKGTLTVTEADGILGLSVEHPADVYDLQGNKVRTKATSLQGLPKGVYVIAGRKVVVR